MPDAPTTNDRPTQVGSISAAISNAVVGLLHDYTGRGPTHARTTVGADTIVVTLRNSLTKAERTLAGKGQAVEVLAMRRAFQNTMRDDLIAAVERLTGRKVEAFLSDNLHEPDVAVEIFLLAGAKNTNSVDGHADGHIDGHIDGHADGHADGDGDGDGARPGLT